MTHLVTTLAKKGHLMRCPPHWTERDWFKLAVWAVSLLVVGLSIPIHFLIAVNL